MDKTEFLQMLDKNIEMRKDLFIRGFLLTDRKIEDLEVFRFMGIGD